MKTKIFFLFLLVAQIAVAQNYTEVIQSPLLTGVQHSSIGVADVDGDGDQDLLITGVTVDYDISPVGIPIAKLYANDGFGNFTEVLGTPFEGVEEGSMAFADVDDDNDKDVLITGNSDAGFSAKLYSNDGSGNFTEAINTPFDGVSLSSIAFADVDGDNDQDVLITGQNSSFQYTSKLYINDGSGNFTETLDTPFEGVGQSSIAFADIDGDSDQDVLIMGSGSIDGAGPSTRLYTNDSSGAFTEVLDDPFVDATYGAIAFADIDGDNDQDVLITGDQVLGSADGITSKLYTNDGLGNFTEVMDTPFPGLITSAVAFTDIDSDNDQDLLIHGGFGSLVLPITLLYTNDGLGNFTQVEDTPFDDLRDGSIAFADLDGDEDQDVILTGVNLAAVRVSKVYLNNNTLSSSDDAFIDRSMKITPFPNPAVSGNLNIRFESLESDNVIIRVYDVNGSLISQQNEFSTNGKQTFEIEISSLRPGTYFVRLENGGKLGVAKFIVE